MSDANAVIEADIVQDVIAPDRGDLAPDLAKSVLE